MQRRTALSLLSAMVVVGCTDHELAGPPASAELTPSFASGIGLAGAVYVMTNQAAGNEVLVFDRSADGTLGSPTAHTTGGTGTGSGLGSQGALVLAGSRWLLAVNAGSDDVSVFRVEHGGLTLTDRVASGGDRPISVTAHGSLVYVLNAGGAGNISGFRLTPHGELTAIAGSTLPLSGAAVDPAQVEFTPDGSQLVVTEKATNQIVTYAVQ
jgi:DNA-binding beta-propeller fold protein YncE